MEPVGVVSTKCLESLMSKKIVIEINTKPSWKASRGHSSYRGGGGVMGDRRTKRKRTRAAKNNQAIREFN